MIDFKEAIRNEKVQGAIAIVAAVIMYFTPDHIDMIIEAILTAFGIKKFVLKKDE